MSGRGRTWLMVVCSLGVLMVIASMVSLNAALGSIARDTLATQSQLTWIVDGYTLVMACLLLPAGALGDRYGRRAALQIGFAIFAVASLIPAIVDGPVALIVARSVTGIGAAAILPATLSLLTAAFPEEERNKAVGIWAGVGGSSAIAGFMGTAILTQFGPWQTIFWAFAAASALLFVCSLTIGTSKDPASTPIDWWGALTIGGAVAAFVYGVIEGPIRGWSDPGAFGFLIAGLVLVFVFGIIELRREHPLLDIRVFARSDMLTGSITITILFFAMFGYFFVIMQYLQLVLGYNAVQAALSLCPLAAPLLILAIATPWYLPRVGLRVALTTGLVLAAVGLFCICLVGQHSSFIDIAWPMLILSAGIGLCTAPSTTAVTGAVPMSKQGVASAINDTTREVGGALGIALAGSVLASAYSHAMSATAGRLPAPAREPVLGSLAQALAVAERLGPGAGSLVSDAKDAFIQAMDSALMMLGVVALVAAVAVGVLAPGRDGRALRILRRMGYDRNRYRE
ncbi:MAG: MFS transporter [Nocardia sp.]|nr:MFS transporter [Nocardia sp.]